MKKNSKIQYDKKFKFEVCYLNQIFKLNLKSYYNKIILRFTLVYEIKNLM